MGVNNLFFRSLKGSFALVLGLIFLNSCGNHSTSSEEPNSLSSSRKILSSSSRRSHSDSWLALHFSSSQYRPPKSSSSIQKSSSSKQGSSSSSAIQHIYPSVAIGNQIWMAENLNEDMENSWCYENDPENCKQFGRLYLWSAAIQACPKGWHLPSYDEWTQLNEYIALHDPDHTNNPGISLKNATQWNGSDLFGFSALPGGSRYLNGKFLYADQRAFFWSSTDYYSYAYHWKLFEDNNIGENPSYDDKLNAFSVRCINDSLLNQKITDKRDHQTYKIITIGTQVWMAENLNYDTLDGSYSWCYDNKASNCSKYGRLYSQPLAVPAHSSKYPLDHGICPEGWHVPNRDEWYILYHYVNNRDPVSMGHNLKTTQDWTYGTDRFGFSALPGGYYGNDSLFSGQNDYALFWGQSNQTDSSAHFWMLKNSAFYFRWEYIKTDDQRGLSVRCLKDTPQK